MRNADGFEDEVAGWFAGKDFTTDWVSRNAETWHRVFTPLRSRVAEVLEVGSFEGRSAVFFLRDLPLARVTCIDGFPGPLNARFDANLAEFGERIEKLKGGAIPHIHALARKERRFDLIYLDAGKRRDHVLAMSLLAWPMLRAGGVMVWDDYGWGEGRPAAERPRDGIDAFLSLHEDDCEIIEKGFQALARKRDAA